MRLRLKVSVGLRSLEVVALLNSGYEAPSPHLLIPVDDARELGLWPPQEAFEVELDTAGGPLRAWLYPRAGRAKILAGDTESREAEVDIVVSPVADEPLISDLLADELGLAVESFGRGLWRFNWEPKEKVRESVKRI